MPMETGDLDKVRWTDEHAIIMHVYKRPSEKFDLFEILWRGIRFSIDGSLLQGINEEG